MHTKIIEELLALEEVDPQARTQGLKDIFSDVAKDYAKFENWLIPHSTSLSLIITERFLYATRYAKAKDVPLQDVIDHALHAKIEKRFFGSPFK